MLPPPALQSRYRRLGAASVASLPHVSIVDRLVADCWEAHDPSDSGPAKSTRSLCPGVGGDGVWPAARPGYSAVARHAVRNGAAEQIARPASSFVIGARTGGMI